MALSVPVCHSSHLVSHMSSSTVESSDVIKKSEIVIGNVKLEITSRERLIPSGTESIAQKAILEKMCAYDFHVLDYNKETGEVLKWELVHNKGDDEKK